MEDLHIKLTDKDRYFLSVLFALAGHLANGVHGETAVVFAIKTAEYIKNRITELEPDEQ